MAFQTAPDRTSAYVTAEKPVDVRVYCVPRDALLADPSTDGCGYRGTIKGVETTVQNTAPGYIKPAYEHTYLSFVNDADLMCPECGHELSPQTGESGRVERTRNLRKPKDVEGDAQD